MMSGHEELLEKHRRALEAERREEDLMRRSEGLLFVARRVVFQKLAGELGMGPDETPVSLAEQITTLSLAIDRTEEIRRSMRGKPTVWSSQLEEVGAPLYGEEDELERSLPTSLLPVHGER